MRIMPFVALFLCFSFPTFGARPQTATGVVFNDSNGNGVHDHGETGIKSVAVSNGIDVVQTDRHGRYAIPVSDDTIVFVIKPANWQTTIDPVTQIPRFYYVHKPGGSPQSKYPGVAPTGPLPNSIDFPLHKHREPHRFRVVCLGDTQTPTQETVDFLSHDLIEELSHVDTAFGITLGDLVDNNLDMYEPLVQTVGLLQRPWRHVIGNHDLNQDSPNNQYADESYERVFGPSHYAFNYGKVHFVAFDDVLWQGKGYVGRFGEEQLQFLRNDLALVPEDYLIVPLMHIPLNEVEDRDAFFAILDDFPHTFSLSAHWHRQEHFFMDASMGWHGKEPHHHLVNNTACGSWWKGDFDEVGLPHTTMADGGPNGYSIISFDGNAYSVEFKAARKPADYQMNIFAPESVLVVDAAATDLIVNVFAGSERSTVEFRVGDGDWQPMQRQSNVDPFYEAAYNREFAILDRAADLAGLIADPKSARKKMQSDFWPLLRTSTAPRETGHCWHGNLPANLAPGSQFIEVRTTDMFGHTYTGRRVLRVVE